MRRKPENIFMVKDLAEADAAMVEIGELRRRIAARELEAEERIAAEKTARNADRAPLEARAKALETGVMVFAEMNRTDLFQDRKTVELPGGKFGFRKSTALQTKSRKITWEMVLGKLKELAIPKAIRVKESVNKEELLTWPEERLEQVGAVRVIEDKFWLKAEGAVEVEPCQSGCQALMRG
ncbi:MAG: host-nuclease inhibitor Gam family protein [Syntrophobacteraceae bacterium]